MATEASYRRQLRKHVRVVELRSPDGARQGIGLKGSKGAEMIRVPIGLTSRRNAAGLEQLCLQNNLDGLLDLMPIGSLGRALREAAQGHPLTCIDRRGFTLVSHQGRSVWVYAFGGEAFSFGRRVPKLALVGDAAEAVTRSGTFKDWLSSLAPIIETNPRQLVVLAHALSAGLRRPLGHPALMLALVAPTSTGKTTTQRIVSSLVGEPAVTPWNATPRGMQKWLRERPDQPVTLEDFHRADSPDDLGAVIMAAGNSAPRITAATDKHADELGIEATAIVSAERSLSSLLKGGTSGLLARYFEISIGKAGVFDNLKPFVSGGALVQAIEATLRTNHGVGWHAWISLVSKKWPEIERWHQKHLPAVRAGVLRAAGDPVLSELADRLLDSLSFSAFAGVIATRVGFWPIPRATIYSAFGLVLKENLERAQSAGGSAFASISLDAVAAFIEKNRSRFAPLREVHDGTPRPGLVGYTSAIRNKGVVFLFPPGLFAEQFKDYGDEVYDALRRAGFLVTQRQRGNRLSVRIPGAKDSVRSRMEFVAVSEAIRFSKEL